MGFLTFIKRDQATDGTEGGATGTNENTEQATSQTANANTENENISILENANTSPSWKGDERFYQEGQKAGQLKPKFRTPEQNAAIKRKGYKAVMGQPREVTAISTPKVGEFDGLNLGALKVTAPGAAKKDEQPTEEAQTKGKPTKAEKKLIEAKTGAKLAMRMLDTLVNWISKGQYGQHFTPEQRTARNEYREALEQDWVDYLQTLDIPMHPGLVVAFGSMMYAADAFNTPAGQERAQTLKEKVIGKAVGWMFSKKGTK